MSDYPVLSTQVIGQTEKALNAILGTPVELSGAGQQLHGQIRAAVTQITQRLWGDLSAEDLATAGR